MSFRFLPIFTVLVVSASAQTAQQKEPPIDGSIRVHWLLTENLDLASVLDDIAVGAITTATNSPKEYGPHWTGFAQRTGIVAANYGVKSTLEVGLGSLWGEDPRYFRTEGQPMKARLAHVIVSTFAARNKNGTTRPAYARFIAMPGSNFLANQWMPDSQATTNQALLRTGLGFLSRMGENAWKEFIARKH